MATLAIVGAGFCGTMVATHVLRGPAPSLERVVLVEPNGREIGGVAYGTSSTSHTLNVPAGAAGRRVGVRLKSDTLSDTGAV